jgi:hypothetical protein
MGGSLDYTGGRSFGLGITAGDLDVSLTLTLSRGAPSGRVDSAACPAD